MLGSLLALTLAAAPATADAIAATADRICIPALSGDSPWPSDLAAEEKLLGQVGLKPGIPKELSDKIAAGDPQLTSLSRAILASRDAPDGAFGMALGGIEQSCRLMVYRTANADALVSAIGTALVAQGWKRVPAPPTRHPKHAFLRRTAGNRIAIVHLVLPTGVPIGPTLAIEMLPPGIPIPSEYGI